jgi:DNA polymerase I-like protein with 3'-5' exonuclease and polymerase domains
VTFLAAPRGGDPNLVRDSFAFAPALVRQARSTTLVTDAMSAVADLAVPLEVDTATGPTWYDAQKH